MIRLMHHANEFDIEALVATATGVPSEKKQDALYPELIREIVEAYRKVQPNLVRHRLGLPRREVPPRPRQVRQATPFAA